MSLETQPYRKNWAAALGASRPAGSGSSKTDPRAVRICPAQQRFGSRTGVPLRVQIDCTDCRIYLNLIFINSGHPSGKAG
jgi:hypothetical protein